MMPDFPHPLQRRFRTTLLLLPLLVLLFSPFAGRSQGTPGTVPAVPDEPGNAVVPRFSPGMTAAAADAQMSLSDRMAQTNMVAQMREEIRRAFIKQDYEKVLSISQEMRAKFAMEDTGDYYVAAAQLRLTELKALKDGKQPYKRINDTPPTLGDSLPSVEPKPKLVASLPPATAPALPSTPAISEKPSVTDAAPAESKLVAAATTPAAASSTPAPVSTPAPTPDAAAAASPAPVSGATQPAAAAATNAIVPGTPAPKSGDKMIASAVLPNTASIPPVNLGAASAAKPTDTVQQTIGIIVVVLAVLVLAMLVFFVMRRRDREEPAEDLAKTLGGLSYERETPATAPAARRGASSPTTLVAATPEPTARLGSVDSILDEETVEAPKTKKPIPAPPVAKAPQPSPSPKAPAPKAPVAKAPEPVAKPAAPKPEPKPAPKMEAPIIPPAVDDPYDLSSIKLHTPPLSATEPMPEEKTMIAAHNEIDFNTDEIMSRPAINLDALPEAKIEPPQWQHADDAVSIEGIGDDAIAAKEASEIPMSAPESAPSASLRDMESLELPMSGPEIAPEAAETRDAKPGYAPAPGAASGIDKTHTSFEFEGERTDGLSRQEMESIAAAHARAESDFSGSREFHADQTVQLQPDGSYGEATTASLETQLDDQTLGSQTLSSTEEPVAMGSAPQPATHHDPQTEDLFDRERREGKTCFDRTDWGGAVHHLSVAAALRPESNDVKEMLREARRMRKSKERR